MRRHRPRTDRTDGAESWEPRAPPRPSVWLGDSGATIGASADAAAISDRIPVPASTPPASSQAQPNV
jgi:hypothetical protein